MSCCLEIVLELLNCRLRKKGKNYKGASIVLLLCVYSRKDKIIRIHSKWQHTSRYAATLR